MNEAMREPTKEEERVAMNAALTAYRKAYHALPANVRGPFMSCMATVSICILNGTAGAEFTRGFLEDALRSVDEPQQVFIEPTEH